jgi:hypothetical protein
MQAMQFKGSTMPNRERLRVPSTYALRGTSHAEQWVFIAFCAAGFAATVFFVSMSSQIGQAAVVLTGQW